MYYCVDVERLAEARNIESEAKKVMLALSEEI